MNIAKSNLFPLLRWAAFLQGRRAARGVRAEPRLALNPALRVLLAGILVFLGPLVSHLVAQTFPVVHKKALWPDGVGELIFSEDTIEFRAAQREQNSRKWAYSDIQHLDRVSPTELVVLSYEDQKWQLGRDREFRFVLTEGEIGDELFETLRSRLGRPATDRVVGEVEAAVYEIAVKHLHTFGGCEGRLLFTQTGVTYQTSHAKDAREWRLNSEIESVWSQGPYQLEIHAYENNRREFSRTRVFAFVLKEPLDSAFYRDLKMKLYSLALSSEPLR